MPRKKTFLARFEWLPLKYRMTGSVAGHRTVKPPRKLTDEHYRFIDECMADDDELTATKVQEMLKEEYILR